MINKVITVEFVVPTVLAHHAWDSALDLRNQFDQPLPRPHRPGGSWLLRGCEPL